MSILDHPADKAIKAIAGELKKIESLKPPEWVGLVKAGAGNERLPESPDFWYHRLASILLTVYKRGPVGTERLRNKYGERKEHKVSRFHHRKAGGKIIRLGLQKLEMISFIKQNEAKKKGRVIAPKGLSFLEKLFKEDKK
ncbi:MAG: 40S ribosomal protein S19 [Candidatus Micrarchaeota archaeon]